MATTPSELTPIIGEAPPFLEMLEHVSRAAPLSKPVLVIGERGTGKELIASRLHYLSARWDQPLVKLNCAALTESILESELFGHEAGAFTGAARRHTGRFERANEGTLFLDELATIPMRMQENILSVIEYGEFERVGGSETVRVDVRVVGATNQDLPALAHAGKFRADLLDRLAFDVITVPPLRARVEDILTLANHFAVNITAELHREYFPGFSSRAASTLLAHSWPGNVRELKNTIERSVYRAKEPDQSLSHIEFDPFASPYRITSKETAQPDEPTDMGKTRRKKTMQVSIDLKQEVQRFEIDWIEKAMSRARFNQRRAADLLGLSYHQLRALLRKYDLLVKYGRKRKKSGKREAGSGKEK